MKKVGLIVLIVTSSALFTSCSTSKMSGNGYFGVSNEKATRKQQKEFKKPKHKIKKSKAKVRN